MYSDSDDDIIIGSAIQVMLTCAQIIRIRKKNLRKRRWWMLSVNKSRAIYSGSDLIADLRREQSGKFQNFCRISSKDFEILLQKIGPFISRQDTNMRQAIPIKERLAVTLRFLASGDSYHSLSYLFKISHQLISNIVPEVCLALNNELKQEVKMPKTPQEWQKIAEEFDAKWNFPHCVGALDGKHIVIQAPINSGSHFYNYKNTFSVVLMALVDAKYSFIYADVGAQGSVSDGGVFRNTSLFKRLEDEDLMLPPSLPLFGREKIVQFVFLSDDAFPLTNRIMKPFPGIQCNGTKQRIYNYRLSRARRVVENAFGIMASVFRIFRSPILLNEEKVSTITLTCVLLHNFLRNSKTSNRLYTPSGAFDVENENGYLPGTWRQDNVNLTSFMPFRKMGRRSNNEAKLIREEFADYFISTGRIEWQDKLN